MALHRRHRWGGNTHVAKYYTGVAGGGKISPKAKRIRKHDTGVAGGRESRHWCPSAPVADAGVITGGRGEIRGEI